MKKRMTILAILFAAGGLLASPQATNRIDMAIKGCVTALASDVDGLKDNAIFKVACLKAEQPGTDLKACIKALEKIGNKEEDLRIRLHAQMTLAYLKDSSLVARIKADSKEDPDVFFDQLYREISATTVASR